MKYLPAAVLFGVLSASMSLDVAIAQSPTLSRDWVLQLEASLDLDAALSPRARRGGGSPSPIAEYARYYRVVEIDGRAIVEAVFAPPIEPQPSHWRTSRYRGDSAKDLEPAPQPSEDALGRGRRGIHIDEPFPNIFDGGCSVVTLSFDYDSRQLLNASCNGVA